MTDTQVHPAGVVSEIVDRVCHKEQIGIWANEMATALSLGDFLKEYWTFDDTVDLEKEIEAQLLDIIRSALTHPGYDVSGKLQAQAGTIEAQANLIDRLKLEAQCHASEAQTANSTIYEIYQVVTGSTGEPGNWHGAAPVREAIGSLKAKLRAAEKALEPFADVAWKWDVFDPEEEVSIDLTAGDLRTARATLNQIREVDGNKPS